MNAIAGAALAALMAGCATGPVEVLGFGDPESPEELANPLRLACSSPLQISGTWIPGEPRSEEVPTGCWGLGIWTFTAAIDRAAEARDITGDGQSDRCGEHGGTEEPHLEAVYSFHVGLLTTQEGEEPDHRYTLLGGRGASELLRLKVNGDGGGQCQGLLELRSADGTMEWNLRPSQDGQVISGSGEFLQFLDSQW